MGQIIPFENSKLPAHLAKMQGTINDDLTSQIGGGFKSLSIKGKIFTIVAGKDTRTIVMNPLDPEETATNLEVVILKANKTLSKVWYAKEWSEDAVVGTPDCFSNDGTAPDKEAKSPQSKNCATCAFNAFGSGRNGKGKACQDSRRIAVAAPDNLNEPMLLRVPPASLKALAEFGRTLGNRGVQYNAVITKLRFEREEATPKLMFMPVGFLDEKQFVESEEQANSELVKQIIGATPMPHHANDEEFESPKAKAPVVAEEPEVKAAKPRIKSAPAVAVAAPAPVVEKAPEPVVEAAPVVKKAAAVLTTSSVLEDDLDALLLELDG